MKKKETAVELLIQQIKSPEWQDFFIWHKEEAFEQALLIEKKQIMDAYNNGDLRSAELYYNETYGIPNL